jgi:hypothetical protein
MKIERPCNCGSGETRRPLYDARQIFCGYICDKCEEKVKGKYRPEIFDDGDYWHDEPIDDDD